MNKSARRLHNSIQNCAVKGCDMSAIWQPVLKIYAKGYPKDAHQPLTAILGLAVCDRHKDTSKVSDFIGDEGWQQIESGMKSAGYATPDRNSAELSWRTPPEEV